MLTIEKCIQLEPGLKNLLEEEVESIRFDLYELAKLALEDWFEHKR
jgi:hypothetical protein